MADKPKIDLNAFLQPVDSPFANRPRKLIGYDFDQQFEIQARTPRFSNLIQVGGVVSASASIASGSAVNITTTISPAVLHDNDRILGIPFVAVYEGVDAVGSLQIYPSLGSAHHADATKFISNSGYDWGRFDEDDASWSISLANTSGTTADIYVVAQWKYLKNNAGTST